MHVYDKQFVHLSQRTESGHEIPSKADEKCELPPHIKACNHRTTSTSRSSSKCGLVE